MRNTPGPWECSTLDVRLVHKFLDIDPQGVPRYTGIARALERLEPGTTVANARLIAAAPELLAALEAIASTLLYGDEVWGDCPDATEVYDSLPEFTVGIAKQVASALAKAKGGTP